MNHIHVVAIRKPLLISVCLALLIALSLFSYFLYSQWQNQLERKITNKKQRIEKIINLQLKVQARELRLAIQHIIQGKNLEQAFLMRDRQNLLDIASPLYNHMLEEHDISHFYFIDLDQTSFLRVHHPDRYGDLISRHTLDQAIKTGTAASGIELGPFGTFTHSYVTPWLIKGQLAGYLEVGKDVKSLATDLKKILNEDFLFLVNKTYLDKNKWTEGLKILDQNGQWDNLTDYIITEQTIKQLPPESLADIDFGLNLTNNTSFHIKSDNTDYLANSLPLNDASRTVVGQILILLDYSIDRSSLRQIFQLIATFTFIGLLIAIATSLFIGRQQKQLQATYTKLQDEIEVRKKTEEDLKEYEEHLEHQVAIRTATLDQSYKQLEIAKQEWEQCFDAMEDIVTIQDMDMTIIRANKSAHNFFNLSLGQLVGAKCHALFRGQKHPCDDCPLLRSISDGQQHKGIITHQHLDTIFQISSGIIYDSDMNFQYLVHVAQDITGRRKLEDELSQKRKMDALGTLAGGIAHDFNNILTAILGFTQLSIYGSKKGLDVSEHLQEVLNASRQAQDLVKQILTFSRKSDNSAAQNIEPHLVVQESLKLLRASFPKSIEIIEDVDPACGMITAEQIKIQQVVVNLCTNALHAMEGTKGVLQVGLRQTLLGESDLIGHPDLSPGHYIELLVSDNGCGIDPRTLEHIFEPFFTTKESGKGTGLGLSTTHGIVKECGGMIKVDSVPGQGTTFRIFFPVLQNDSEQSSSLPEEN